jgi:uncharacterized protein (TIGR02452 family)
MKKMTKFDNIEVFNDTQKVINSRKSLLDAVKNSNANQQYWVTEEVPTFENRFDTDAKIVVSKSTSFGAARKYNGEIAVLNFASATNPGGGVTHGSFAQEECLCRCSTLYNNLILKEAADKFYLPHRSGLSPLHNDDIIYTPGVVVFKSDDYKDYGTTKNVNIITCAAPNLREVPKNEFNSENTTVPATISDDDLLELHKQRGRKILSVAAANKNDFIVLGAFGCGAFRNDPKIVAEAYKQILPEFKNAFKVIEFAVFCRDHETINYDTFKEILNG